MLKALDSIWTQLTTEQPNAEYDHLDTWSVREILVAMNAADKLVPDLVASAIPQITRAVEVVVQRLRDGGRLFYAGAGTSGRLGVLDAAECPPTFNTPPDLVQAVIAGGSKAMFEAVEEAEDHWDFAEDDLRRRGFSAKDVLIGITASGRTPYVLGAISYARGIGAFTISISCNTPAMVSQYADLPIEVPTGNEIVMGSTRLKAGTAQKLVLNMISTATMVRLGKVYRNLMVDLRATNEKLVERSKRIIMLATGVSYERAEELLAKSDGQVKVAILMAAGQVDRASAEALLERSRGFLRTALEGLAQLDSPRMDSAQMDGAQSSPVDLADHPEGNGHEV
ncbi:N-acetylmuramic acid 6-phosphate etherase [Alicyclobacillus macrosporangiidus]|uniref:N-acetylmuramic acid 6-phosphate etherase n=1 Tax=Alicyclobacillus macrosporangiidus TaxID=392015 RepID=A0A1I7G9F9_9BACL|nr:N-acetylmuramic acid 6-phosphate etherase [Alicyclobacillus macrosporangiidus]